MSAAVRMFVYVPEAGQRMPAQQKFPVLVYVDPPDAAVTGTVENQPGETISCTVQSQQYGAFNRILWIDKLPQDKNRSLSIVAEKMGLDPAGYSCVLRRHSPMKAAAAGTTLEVVYPTPNATVPPNFTAYGYVNPPGTGVDAWLDDGNGNTYAGVAIPPGTYDWSVAFQNIPAGSYNLYVQAADGTQVVVPITVQAGSAGTTRITGDGAAAQPVPVGARTNGQ